MEETIQRLTREKMDLMKQHSQEILLKDKMLHEIKENYTYLMNQNDRLIQRVNYFQQIVVICTQKMSNLLKTTQLDNSFDDKEMLEDFKNLEISQKHISQNLQNSVSSGSDFMSNSFAIHPLQTCLTKLEKTWEIIITQLKSHKKDQSLTKYLKDQLVIMEQEQRALRTQKNILQSIHNESEKSRHEILQRTRKHIQSALKTQKIDFQKMSVQDLRQKIGSLVIGIEELRTKTKKLEEQLYRSKMEFTDKLQYMKQTSAKIKEKSQNQLGKMEKQINSLKSSVSKH